MHHVTPSDSLRQGTSASMAYDVAMSRFAPLLRALLCLALLFNGTAYAQMATRMAVSDMSAAMPSGDDDMPPCHEGMDMTVQMDDADTSSLDHHGDEPGVPDCCKTGSCDGFCAQHAPALGWLAPSGAPPYPRADVPAYRADAHASVRLSNRHRPPILAA